MPLVLLILGLVGVGAYIYVNESKAAAAIPPATTSASSAVVTGSSAPAPIAPAPPPVVISSPPSSTAVATSAATNQAVEAAANQIPVVGPVVAAVESIILGQHTQRLNDAIAENQLIPQVVEAFDADLQQIEQAYNDGEATAAQCIAALQAMDLTLYSTLRNNAQAKPGIAWNTDAQNTAYQTTQQLGAPNTINPAYGAPCDKSCTVSCCVYFNDLRPGIYGRNVVGAGNTSKTPYAAYQNPAGSGIIMGAIQAIQNAEAGLGPQTVYIIPISPPDDPAYGNYTRASYNLVFTNPAPASTAKTGSVSVTAPLALHLALA